MHNQEPANKPYCCSKQAKWIIISPRLAYFYCESCKKEVAPISAYTQDEYDSMYGEQPTLPGFSIYDPAPAAKPVTRAGLTYKDVFDAVDALRASDGNAYAPNSPNNPDKNAKLTDAQHQSIIDKLNDIYRVRWEMFDYDGYYKSTKE